MRSEPARSRAVHERTEAPWLGRTRASCQCRAHGGRRAPEQGPPRSLLARPRTRGLVDGPRLRASKDDFNTVHDPREGRHVELDDLAPLDERAYGRTETLGDPLHDRWLEGLENGAASHECPALEEGGVVVPVDALLE